MPHTSSLDDYRLLGRSGLRVSPLALGTMTFGEEWGWGAGPDEAARIFDLYLDRGGNFVDTSVNYTDGAAERLLGRFLKGRRERVVVGTKFTMAREPGNPNSGGNHRLNMIRSVETSLRQLDTDRIDLLYLHGWDFTTSAQEVMRGLDDLVTSGKVVYVGICNTPAWRIAEMQTTADLLNWSPFVALQIEYSLIQRTVEHELMPLAANKGMGVVPWSALGGGVLTGKYGRDDLADGNGQGAAAGSRKGVIEASGNLTERTLAIADVVREVAAELHAGPAQVALAWTLAHPSVTAPVIGARTLAQAEKNIAALDVVLAEEHLQRLDAASSPEPIFPASFMQRPLAKGLVFGGATVATRG
ncbi:aryl-alcohol dehydrogenase-like predicted oxidoreductase [Streptomyces phaeochromogenes]|jgi:aryl-alcohol dehydrogenase-like predicted oxidoreductase|uniref:aldo/keto reductase n=1 Tax=Streptomyces phaeochromogenes TaxID=1923 RepID=UPI0027908EB7|nr:aldo/keto reductase [Streptomyces phaeochromogenes]MDQ0947778.1 aryl-alcohol dehydrogenase-like predicted oxidoreductase [Streptomyces phaeochromogenes]